MNGKIIAIIVLLNVAPSLTLNAQWAKTYGGSEEDIARSIIQTGEGGYVLLGTTESFGFGNGYSDLWVIKMNSDGNIEWEKTYGDDYTNNAYSFQQTKTGRFMISGSLVEGVLGHRFWIIRLSPSGDIEWQDNYGDDSVNYAFSLDQTSDGGLIIAGVFGNNAILYDLLVIKLSPGGTVEWRNAYKGYGDDKPSSILQTSDGGYIIAGITDSYGAGGTDILVIKLSPDGSVEWQKTYGGDLSESANCIFQTNDSGYIIAGSTNSFGAGQGDLLVLKLSYSGEIDWNRAYGGSGTDAASSIQQTFDGGYVVVGRTNSFGAGGLDVWILKMNSEGNIDWQKTYGGGRNEEGSCIQQTYDGGYIVTGSTDTYGAGDSDFLVLKLFPNGEVNSTCAFVRKSNAYVYDIDISPVDSHFVPEYFDLISKDMEEVGILVQDSEAIVYSLCSGRQTLNIASSSGGTTVPQPGTYTYEYAESVNLSAKPDTGYNFKNWSGDFSSHDKSISITMDSDKYIQANFELNVIEEVWERVKRSPCFIATAAYGSPIHPFVRILQEFRDKYLIPSKLGRKLVSFYYEHSPQVAAVIAKHKELRVAVCILLVPAVALGYSIVHLGPIITVFIFILTFMTPFLLMKLYRRKMKKLIGA
jgi:hypothetical protein